MRNNDVFLLLVIICLSLSGCGPLLLVDKPKDAQPKSMVYIVKPLFFSENPRFVEMLAQRVRIANDPGDADYLLYIGQTGNHILVSLVNCEGQIIISDNEIVIVGKEQAVMRLVVAQIFNILNNSPSSNADESTNYEESI